MNMIAVRNTLNGPDAAGKYTWLLICTQCNRTVRASDDDKLPEHGCEAINQRPWRDSDAYYGR